VVSELEKKGNEEYCNCLSLGDHLPLYQRIVVNDVVDKEAIDLGINFLIPMRETARILPS